MYCASVLVSGLATFHAMLIHTNPKVVAIGFGYYGCRAVPDVFRKVSGCRIVNLLDESTWSGPDFA